jgi:toxin-antitoxin system PIN domain toxin
VRALLDINVLIALLDAQHVHHRMTLAWLQRNIADGWASCPLTQNGVIRILSQPAYPGSLPPTAVAGRLADATRTEWHLFWPDDISLLDAEVANWDAVLGSRQVSDTYLLALAVHHGGRFVSLNRRVNPRTVPGATQASFVMIE